MYSRVDKIQVLQPVAVSQAQQISFNLRLLKTKKFQTSEILQAIQTPFDSGEAKVFQLAAVAQVVEISWNSVRHFEDLQIWQPQETVRQCSQRLEPMVFTKVPRKQSDLSNAAASPSNRRFLALPTIKTRFDPKILESS